MGKLHSRQNIREYVYHAYPPCHSLVFPGICSSLSRGNIFASSITLIPLITAKRFFLPFKTHAVFITKSTFLPRIFLFIFPLLLTDASIILNFLYGCCVIKITLPGEQDKKSTGSFLKKICNNLIFLKNPLYE